MSPLSSPLRVASSCLPSLPLSSLPPPGLRLPLPVTSGGGVHKGGGDGAIALLAHAAHCCYTRGIEGSGHGANLWMAVSSDLAERIEQ